MKKQPTIKNPYYLRMRVRQRNGEWGEWVNRGVGEFTDLETAQRSIRLLMATYPTRDKQIEFKHENRLKDYNGMVTGEPINFRKR